MPTAAGLYYHHYEGSAQGVKPPLVLIHGAGGNYLHWHPQLRRLSDYRIFAPDLPGHGKSGGRGQQSIEGYADSILEWMEATELHSAVFVGHSMGNAIVLNLVLNYPKNVLGLVSIGGGARLRVKPELLDATSNPTTYHQAIEQIIKLSFSPNTSEQITMLAAERMQQVRPSVLHGDFLACMAFDVTEDLARIYRPTLVLCGAEDQMTPPRFSQYLADNIPNAEIEIIPDAGHMVILEQPGGVAQALSGFLPSIIY